MYKRQPYGLRTDARGGSAEPGSVLAVPDEATVVADPGALAEHVRAHPAVVHEVTDLDPVLTEDDVADNPPVAAPPHGLAAHDGHAQSFRLLGQQLGQPGPEVL